MVHITATTDKRTRLALDIIGKKVGAYKIYKTTRAGATTSLCIGCLIRKKPFLVLEPTNRIIEETIIADVKTISGRKDAVIIHVPSNFKCLENKYLMEKYEDFKEFDYLPLAQNCGECCNFEICPITEIRRFDKFDGICMTYDKLIALKTTAELFPDSYATEVIEKLNQVGVVIFDEAHELMYDRISSLGLYELIYGTKSDPDLNETPHGKKILTKSGLMDNKFASKFIDKLKYANRDNDNGFIILDRVVSNYLKIITTDNTNEAISELENLFLSGTYGWWKRNHSIKIENTNFKSSFGIKKKQNSEGKLEVIDVNQSNVNNEAVQEMMDLTKTRHRYNISIEEITSVFKMLDFVTSENLDIKARKVLLPNKDEKLTVSLLATNHDFNSKLKEFVHEIQRNHLLLFTSATFCSYNYNQLLLPETKLEDVLFGDEGDPFRNNAKHTLFCDTKTYSSIGNYSIENLKDEIIEQCSEIMDIHGSEDCMIFCKNIDEYNFFNDYFENSEYNPYVTYYRAAEVMGVKSSYRVGIHIGLAHVPTDSHDHSFDNIAESRIRSQEQMHCDTWQATSRVKDPDGEVPSISFMLGATVRDVANICSWGINRSVEIIPTYRGGKKEINVHIEGDKISSPTVVDTRDWNKSLILSIVYRFGFSYNKAVDCYKCENLQNNFIITEFAVDSKSALLNTIFDDIELPTQLKYGNGTFSKKDKILDEKKIDQYVDGTKKLYLYPVSNMMTNFVMFESTLKIAISKLKLFFDTNKLPYVIEKTGKKYRAWIFLKNTYVTKARNFGKEILKTVDINKNNKATNTEYIMYPKYARNKKKDSTEGLIELPFGRDSQILIYGEFVDNLIMGMNVGIIDINGNES